MVPQTYPSILNPYTNRHEMVVKQLASTSGLQRWTDYIPVKLSASTRPAGEQTTDGDGFIAINTSQNTSTGVAFKDWVPVYFDNDATDAWVVSASGYIPIGASGGAIAILKSFGSNAHVYLPGANGVAVSGLPTNNYTLSNGSTGYSAVDGTAGLVLDAAGAVGAELVTNGDNEAALFSLGTITSINVAASRVAAIGGRSGFVALAQSNTSTSVAHQFYCGVGSMAANTAYLISVDVYVPTGGVSNFRFFDNADGSFFSPNMTTKDAWVTVSCIRQPKATSWTIGIGNNTADVVTSGTPAFYVDNFSAKPVTGIHVTQATTANKPALRRGLYNLLTYSNDYTNAAWAKTAIPAPTTGIADPWGGNTAQKIVATAVATNHYLSPSFGGLPPANTTCTYAVIASASGESVLGFGVAGGTAFSASFNLLTGVATANNTTAEMKSLGAGWYLCVMVATPTAYGHSPYITIRATQTNFTGDGVSGLNLAGLGLFYGVLSAQQILAEGGIPLTTSTAASNSGAGRYSWQFDGTNDSLNLGSVPFQMADDHCVIAGFTPNAGNTFAVGITNAGGTTMCGNLRLASDGHLSAWWKDDVAAQSLIYGPSSVIGATLVASAQKVGNVKSLRSNGTQVSTDSTVLGATTLTDANIGSLTSVSGFMDGSIGPVILIKGTVSDADLLTLERWVASQMPNGPQF